MTPSRGHILIIEDEKPLAQALELKLKKVGYQTAVAYTGKSGLSLMKAREFDVVLLDLLMPIMDGFEVLAQINKLPKKPTVFVLSNLGQREDEKKALAMGAKKFFIKSNTPLTAIVEQIMMA